MSKKYLRSDISKEEAHFWTSGEIILGESNAITGLYKIIGKYLELKECGREKEITQYSPEKDLSFKYENRGITELSSLLKNKYGASKFSRKTFRTLSRKWKFHRVLIYYNADCIINELFAYINYDMILKQASDTYLSSVGLAWGSIMPIQYDFLSTRFTDEHKNYRVAGQIINNISNIKL